ncbi:discoidin domain-containing protein [Paenibacillus farraposensis]|uniref:Discoidin domain-containing protein n=1 Tax=Paenibacillus farraposensis TaxID=2807095 RepID=A0ABW4DAU8_9BACL|nr:discoidin domain-containing protein [Paenibacillus farraposensis]MCC3379014.1 discoidin domain-containing protein [Paenibacillus farraposensis]
MKKACITILFLVLLSLPLSNAFAAETEYSENLIPNMTTHTYPSGVASASNEFSYAYRSFDGDFATIESAWGSDENTAWLRYDFPKPEVIEQYVIYPQTTATDRAPKDWTFEGSNDGVTWNVLDTQSNITGWVDSTPKKFTFSNSNSYKDYRINITANNGSQILAISELEMMSKVSSSTPNTGGSTPNPGGSTPNTGTNEPVPSGNRAILVVTMTNGLEKEFDLSMKEVNDFIAWYEGKQAGSGSASYAINKHDNNKGPFSSRKDYMLFDRILTFEVSEYSK